MICSARPRYDIQIAPYTCFHLFATPIERHDAQFDANLRHLKLHLSPHIQAEEKRQALIDKQNTKLLQRIVDIMTSKKKSFPVAETRRKVMTGHKSVLINMQLIIIYHPPNVLYITDCIALLETSLIVRFRTK